MDAWQPTPMGILLGALAIEEHRKNQLPTNDGESQTPEDPTEGGEQ